MRRLAALALAGLAATAVAAADPYAPVETLVRVLGLIETSWVDEIDTARLVDGALRGMTGVLDPHSAWLDAAALAALERSTEGEYVGVGVELAPDANRVVRVIPGGPAARAGIQIGDEVLTIDGAPSDPDAAGLLGPRGSVVHLTLRRGDATVAVDVTRDLVHATSVESGWLADGVGYVRLITFQQASALEVGTAIARLQAERPLGGLVLDLRDNPGGLVDEAVAIADLFLDEGVIVATEGRRADVRAVHRATPGGVGPLPLVVVVNGESASASEILAAALQDTRRATLVGTRTWGKGTVQGVFRLRDGGALKLTTARYLTPAGTPVAPREGRTPDVVVEPPAAASPKEALRQRIAALPAAQRDAMLPLLEPLGDVPPSPPRVDWEAPLAARATEDPQLRAAVAQLVPAAR